MARRSVGLGERHYKIMEFLSQFQEQNRYSPSIREIGESIGVNSTSLVDYYLKQLEDMHYIERDNHISRSIRILHAMPQQNSVAEKVGRAVKQAASAVNELLTIPVAGRIVASAPIPVPPSDLAYFDPESGVEIARSLLPPREKISELFALEVQGDSMIDAMINDGDIVIMKRAQEAQNGEMVAVWLNDNDETTLKYFYKENNRVRLQPANPTMNPIYVDNPAQVRIMGKVVMVIRQVKSIAM
ncbi:MAG: repressor LexA [Chloroflexi bacterium]|nr:transcriptional repressor LexA [Anaerolineaceae bacterium]NMB89741.1 repressor LexA [Chloroflexota bacterium]